MSIITAKWFANQAIEQVQNFKSNVLKSAVTEEKIRQPLQSVIDAQTLFAKTVVDVADELYYQGLNYMTAQAKATK